MAATSFAERHPADRTAVAFFIGCLWFGLLSGFVPSVAHGFVTGRTYQPVTHLHALTAVGWMSLVTWQALLVRAGQIAGHRRLGKRVGVALALAVGVSALFTVLAVDTAALDDPAFDIRRLAFQAGHIVPFVVLTGAALLLTSHPAAHKRLLLLGVVAVLDAGWSRWVGRDVVALVGDGVAGQMLSRFPLAWALIVAMGGYDIVTRGRLHPLFVPAAAFLLATQFGSAWLFFQPWWAETARSLIGG